MLRIKKIKQFLKDYQDQLVFVISAVLISFIAFNLGRLSNKGEKLRMINRGERLVLEFKGRLENQELLFKTLPQATVKLDGAGIIDLDSQGNFSLAPSSLLQGPLIIYTDQDLIQLDLTKFLALKELARAAGAKQNQEGQREEASKQKAPDQERSFIASRKSNKYHLKDCSWAKRIKKENRVWFSSAKEAEEQGYQPAQCVKRADQKIKED